VYLKLKPTTIACQRLAPRRLLAHKARDFPRRVKLGVDKVCPTLCDLPLFRGIA
jgi:hypothetical protein